jgi:hypothetical protein
MSQLCNCTSAKTTGPYCGYLLLLGRIERRDPCGMVYAALQGFLAGCLQLAVELPGGRNRFANRARFTALLALSA